MKLFFLLAYCFTSFGLFAQNLVVVYPKAENAADIRDDYFYELLEIALEKSLSQYGNYELKQSDVYLPGPRVPVEVSRDRYVNIFTSPTSQQLEQAHLPIRIPLVKGIQGLRIALINREDQPKFNLVSNASQLKSVVLGQGATWLDTLVFQNAKLNVISSPDYESLFRMLSAKRFDAFPRGLNEIFREYEERKGQFPEFSVEENIIIYYDLPVYFFVNKENKELQERLYKGLTIAIEDGSFDRHFYRYFGEDINRAKLSQRRLIALENNFISKVDRSQKSLWLPFINERGNN